VEIELSLQLIQKLIHYWL